MENRKSKIPKILHYVWLSNDPHPDLISRCIESWQWHLPDYEFILWDRSKAESIDNQWLRQTIAAGKYAFATDFIRIYALYSHGGIYLDADVELLDNFDPFLHQKFFIGFEYSNNIEPAVFGSIAGHPLLKELLNYYRDRSFIKQDGTLDIRPLPYIFNEKASGFGFKPTGQKQYLAPEGIAIFPCETFSPKNSYFKKIKTTSATVAIHHFDAAWVKRDWKYRIKKIFHQALYLIGGKKFHNIIIQLFRRGV